MNGRGVTRLNISAEYQWIHNQCYLLFWIWVVLWYRGQSELLSPVVRDDEVTIAARRRKKVACILYFKALFRKCFHNQSTKHEKHDWLSMMTWDFMINKKSSDLSVLLISWALSSVPSPSGGSPVSSMVTPARSLLRNTPASLYRQAGKNYLIQMLIFYISMYCVLVKLHYTSCSTVTPRVPDVSAILVPGGRTPRYTHTPRNALNSVVR